MSVLLDTSVWIRHFKTSNLRVVQLLESELVVSHEFVVGEMACGSLKSREETLGYLKELIALPTVSTQEAMLLVESRNCLLYTSPSPRDGLLSRMPSSA